MKKRVGSFQNRGFTIVELLIVIVVVAILAVIVIVAYNGTQKRSRDATRSSDVAIIKKALELYHTDNDGYPRCGGVDTYVPGTSLAAGTVAGCLTSKLVPRYVSKLPNDPLYNSANTTSPENRYEYMYAVGYKKDPNSPTNYSGNQSDNYIIGMEFETSTGPRNSGWARSQNYLDGSNN